MRYFKGFWKISCKHKSKKESTIFKYISAITASMQQPDNALIKDNKLFLKVNTKIYTMDTVIAVSNLFIDKLYISIDGEPGKEVTIELIPKFKINLIEVANEFNSELVKLAEIKKNDESMREIREAVLERALGFGIINNYPEEESEEEDFIKDPEGIRKPWEEEGSEKETKE